MARCAACRGRLPAHPSGPGNTPLTGTSLRWPPGWAGPGDAAPGPPGATAGCLGTQCPLATNGWVGGQARERNARGEHRGQRRDALPRLRPGPAHPDSVLPAPQQGVSPAHPPRPPSLWGRACEVKEGELPVNLTMPRRLVLRRKKPVHSLQMPLGWGRAGPQGVRRERAAQAPMARSTVTSGSPLAFLLGGVCFLAAR